MRIYLDGIFLLNMLVDLMLILGTNRLTGFPPNLKRSALGAVFGGIYGSLCLLQDLRFLGNFLWRTVFFCLMSVLAFGCNRSAWRRGAILFLLSMALGGIATGAEVRDFAAICFCALLVALLCRVGFGGQQMGNAYIPVELNWQGNIMKIMALQDTGNTLRDPLTGERVLVCGADVGAELLGIPEGCFCDPVQLVAQGTIPGLRLVPYRTIGQPGGIMVLLRLKNVKLGEVEQDALVAFAPHRIGSREGYRMLTGGMLS